MPAHAGGDRVLCQPRLPIWITMSTYRFIRDLSIGLNLYLCAFGYVWQSFPLEYWDR
jgi:hypothetical protein